MGRRAINEGQVFMYRPRSSSMTNFPDMWLYFMHDPQDSMDIENHVVWAGVQVNSLNQKGWKQGRDNLGFNDYEVWLKGGDSPMMNQFFYLADRDSLLFLDDLSTPKREENYGTEEQIEKMVEQEEQVIAKSVRKVILRLENEEIDVDSLPWVYSSHLAKSKRDYHDYWARNQVSQTIQVASSLMYNLVGEVEGHLKNIKESERLENLAKQALDLSKLLKGKSFDRNYNKAIRAKYKMEMEEAKRELDAHPTDTRLNLIYRACKGLYESTFEKQKSKNTSLTI